MSIWVNNRKWTTNVDRIMDLNTNIFLLNLNKLDIQKYFSAENINSIKLFFNKAIFESSHLQLVLNNY